MKTGKLPGMSDCIPPIPTLADESVAVNVASAIVAFVNDETEEGHTYWVDEEIEERVNEMASVIMDSGNVENVFGKCETRFSRSDSSHPWGYVGLDMMPQALINSIADDVLKAAIQQHQDRYT